MLETALKAYKLVQDALIKCKHNKFQPPPDPKSKSILENIIMSLKLF